MKKYEFKLQDTSDDFTTAVQVGTHAASLRCTWAIASNEQSDILEKSIREASLRDPLISRDKMTISRAYDWVEFYYNIRYADLEQWFNTADMIPQSITGMSTSQAVSVIQQRVVIAESTVNLRTLYKETLRWQFTWKGDEDTITGFIQPGGWYRWQDRSYAFRFVSDREYIGKDDLPYIKVEIEVYDE